MAEKKFTITFLFNLYYLQLISSHLLRHPFLKPLAEGQESNTVQVNGTLTIYCNEQGFHPGSFII